MYTIWIRKNDNSTNPYSNGYDSIETAFVIVDELNDRGTEDFYYVVENGQGKRWTRENGNGKLIIW